MQAPRDASRDARGFIAFGVPVGSVFTVHDTHTRREGVVMGNPGEGVAPHRGCTRRDRLGVIVSRTGGVRYKSLSVVCVISHMYGCAI